MKRIKSLSIFLTLSIFIAFGGIAGYAQTTEFPYQGNLNNNVNGSFDFEFRLFDTATGGTLIGSQQRLNVTVTNGGFSVVLNFGEFPPENRFLEIAIRELGGTTFTTLPQRDKLLSTPYSTQARNAENAVNAVNAQNAQNAASSTNATNAQTAQNALRLGGTPANQFVLGNDPRLSDARPPAPNSSSYIQNGTNQQTSSNFNISGNGTVGGTFTGNIIKANVQFDIGDDRVLSSAGIGNIFAGKDAGAANTGLFNSFVGAASGFSNTTGFANSFFGSTAGGENTTGSSNSFFGLGAGNSNTTGSSNSFYGANAGFANTTASNNSFFGTFAGSSNTVGNENAFFGFEAGKSNVSGSRNTFFGDEAGESNVSGSSNSYFGRDAGKLSTGTSNTYIGNLAGSADTSGSRNTFVGDVAGLRNLTGTDNAFFGSGAGSGNTEGFNNTAIGAATDVSFGLINSTAIGARAAVDRSNSLVLGSIDGVNGATVTVKVGIGTTTPEERLHVNGIIRVDQLGTSGPGILLCQNESNQIAPCEISFLARSFESALAKLKRTNTGTDVDAATAELREEIKRQQSQIERHQEQLRQQQLLIEDLRKFVGHKWKEGSLPAR